MPLYLWTYSLLGAVEGPVNPVGGDWVSIVATYGLAAPMILFLLYVVKELRKDIADKDKRLDAMMEALTERVVPLVTESTSALKEAADVIRQQQATAKAVIEAGEIIDDSVGFIKDLVREFRKERGH